MNALEEKQDPKGEWRRASNIALAGEYQALFSQLDLLLMLQVPTFEAVYRWRKLQEDKLGQRSTMAADELQEFIMHYERLTRTQLQEMPMRADLVLQLDDDHQVKSVRLGAYSLPRG